MTFLHAIWAWIVANKAILLSLLPTLIIATSAHPQVSGLLKVIATVLDRASFTQHHDSKPRRFIGHFKIPILMGSQPAVVTLAPLYKVVVVDFGGTGVEPAEIVAYAAAQQRQINEQFAMPAPMGWGVGVQYVRAAANAKDIRPDEVVIGLFATADQPGALGYHDKTPSGMPVGHVFPPLDKADGVPWTTTASHELTEILGDPELNDASQRPDGVFMAKEVADAVEQDTYEINGVPLSNFCLPLWYGGPASGAKYDYLGLCKAPFEIRPGGYAQSWSDDQGWTQTFAQKAPRAYRAQARPFSRHARRQARAASRVRAATA